MTNTKVAQVQELRRSNASRPIPAKKVRKQATRAGRRAAALKDWR
ncbi:MAG: hypothetical protein WC054_00100 [Candidatus Nanopelagicales bacterium]